MMKLHTITGVKPYDDLGRLLLRFDDDDRPELTSLVDLSPMLAQGGVFEPLRDAQIFCSVEIGPSGRTLVWHVGEDVVDLCADALWMMSHHDAVGSPRRSPDQSSKNGQR